MLEAAPDTGSAVSGARPVPGPGWERVGWESRAGAGPDPREATPVGSFTRARSRWCPRGQGRAQGCPPWMQSLGWAPENSELNSKRCSCSLLRGSHATPSAQRSQARAETAVINPISLSRNNSGPFQHPRLRQDPLGNPGAGGLCKRLWNNAGA